ncbi:Imm32 family immunity protein [Marinobacter nauticus]|uniref:Imm32 family immunity protein n=1 Tax=Marinobacter nauticus TaxID=2743 RepID=UPI001C59B5B5|nr:Imm32 family immunity protein [Marinobacter nauticus]MBW3197020.1 immunity protein 32 [Marinobacter nauticus]MBY6182430.1 immunity protein 32 [Marinobacter nauticus]
MEEYLLTFETDEEGEQIFVHGDPAGLEYFAKQLLEIAAKAKAGEFPHDHYFTEEWGGNELSSEPQSEKCRLINHVKVYGWPTVNGGKPYSKT